MNEKRYLEGRMKSSDQRRSSKWDSKEEPRVAYKNMHGSGKSGVPLNDRETSDWLSPHAAPSSHSKWAAAELFPGSRGSRRDENIDEDRIRNSKRMRTWEEESYGTRMSPGLDHWRQQSRQRPPTNEWKRLRRSRSLSRSRSRSPIQGFGRDSGPNDHRSRSGAPARLCRDYASGWCKRGDHCRFLHGQTSQDSWERQQRNVTPKYPMPRSHEYPKGNESSLDYCIEFLKGSCRRGSSCRFAHHNDRSHRDGSLERHNDREPQRASEIPCKYFAAGNCRNGKHCRFSHQEQNYRSPDKSRDGRVLRDHGSAKWVASSDGLNLTEDKYEIGGPTYRGETNRSVDDKWGHCLEEDKKIRKSSNGDKINVNKKNGVVLGAHAKLDFAQRVGEQWVGDMDMSPEWNYNVPASKPIDKQTDLPNWEPDVTKQATVQMPDAAVVTPSKTNVKGMSSSTLPVTGLSAVGQGQIAFTKSGVIMNPQIQIGVQEEKVVNKPETVESISPHFKSGVSIMQNNVSTEQLTAISASIAQLLANGQQFQPYGSFAENMKGTSPSPFDDEGSIKKDPALNMQSNENMDSIVVEKHEVNHNPPGFFPPPNTQKNIATGTLETTSNNKTPSSAANVTGSKAANGKSSQAIQLEVGGNSVGVKENNGKLTEDTAKEGKHRENGPLENNDGDEKTDDGKKGKEAKGVRTFKFALVEFVKEVLKPTWKEGQMSKDAYKNIVKKVVDKVTGSIQEANVPQTQEKIQQYLSHSKPKLTKLVEAYLGKFQKEEKNGKVL